MANTFKSAATGSRTDLLTMYTCPAATTAVVHAVYLKRFLRVTEVGCLSLNIQEKILLLKKAQLQLMVLASQLLNLKKSYFLLP